MRYRLTPYCLIVVIADMKMFWKQRTGTLLEKGLKFQKFPDILSILTYSLGQVSACSGAESAGARILSLVITGPE